MVWPRSTIWTFLKIDPCHELTAINKGKIQVYHLYISRILPFKETKQSRVLTCLPFMLILQYIDISRKAFHNYWTEYLMGNIICIRARFLYNNTTDNHIKNWFSLISMREILFLNCMYIQIKGGGRVLHVYKNNSRDTITQQPWYEVHHHNNN